MLLPSPPKKLNSYLSMLFQVNVLNIFFLALFVRLFNLFLIQDYWQHAFVEDSQIYWNGAKYWIESGFFSDFSKGVFVYETVRVPGYYLFLMPFRFFFSDSIFLVLTAQSIVDSLTCAIIFKTGLFFSRNIGVVSGMFAVISYNLIIHTSLILTETISLFFLSLSILLYFYYLREHKIGYLFIVGLVCGFGAMTRTVILLLPIVFLLANIVIFRNSFRRQLTRAFTGALVLIFATALPVSPLFVRNYNSFDTFQLTSQNGAFLLNWVTGITRMLESGNSFDVESAALNRKLEDRISEKYTSSQNIDNFLLSKERVDLALDELSNTSILSIAHAWFYGMTKNILGPTIAFDPRVRGLNSGSFSQSPGNNLLEKFLKFIERNNKVYVTFLLLGTTGTIVFVLLQLIGIRSLFAINASWAFFLCLYLAYFLLISGPIGGPKYRIPIEPVLIILQAAGFVYVLQKLKTYWIR
ncbi:MAG: glycosyltransferase family 39 protein [Betaproteobacteria bacterium]